MVEGAEITTVEGLGTPTELAPVQAAFDEHYAAQCGFCTSGFLMASHALIEDGGGTTREEVVEALSGHVCRCTGYVKIVDAVTAAARGDVAPAGRRARHGTAGRGRRHDDPREPGMKAVGARLPRYDGVAHVTARTLYVDDVRVPGTLWTKALRSPHDHAVITHLDASQGRGAARRARGRDRRRRAQERLRPPRGPRRPRRRAAARRRRGPLQGPADRRRGGRERGDRDGRGGGHRRALRGAPRVLRPPQGARPRHARDPPLGPGLSALRPAQPPPGPQGRPRRRLRRRRHDRRGRLPPAGDRALPDGDAGVALRARRPTAA